MIHGKRNIWLHVGEHATLIKRNYGSIFSLSLIHIYFAPGWLGYYMNSDLFHNQILPYITGIKVSSISKGAISETLILVPPFDEQKKIVQSLNKIQLLMTAETKVVNKIKLVKNGCLSKMFPQKDDTVPEMRLPGFTEAWEPVSYTHLDVYKRQGE